MSREAIEDHDITADDVLIVHGARVMLDITVAAAFGTETKRINEAVTRNSEKFPDDHCFHLTKDEIKNLKSQFATSSL